MGSHLERILDGVREDLARRKTRVPYSAVLQMARARSAADAPLPRIPAGPAIIAEIKRASPSRGWIRRGLDAVATAGQYLAGGAWAVSVLTEERLFGGSLADLARVREAFPDAVLLRKDFLLDEYMVAESRANGADLALLMVSVLGERTGEMVAVARHHRLEPLVEVHDAAELAIARNAGARFIGINNRDLATLSVDLATSERLLPRMPDGAIAVVESGISEAAQVRRLHGMGARLFLIGESLVSSPNPADTIRKYVGE
ncbi:MAG: indole-3-glycerol phosphate synthase TrpC [Verrucomicrobiota bacterium]